MVTSQAVAFDPGAMPDTWEPGPMTEMGPEFGPGTPPPEMGPGPDGPPPGMDMDGDECLHRLQEIWDQDQTDQWDHLQEQKVDQWDHLQVKVDHLQEIWQVQDQMGPPGTTSRRHAAGPDGPMGPPPGDMGPGPDGPMGPPPGAEGGPMGPPPGGPGDQVQDQTDQWDHLQWTSWWTNGTTSREPWDQIRYLVRYG